ncbi:MAG: flagellar cap protein FliD N-terminal domain-containing protein, partial [Azonexus sp.]|nr:flagellar cap protein FliD N-terminal domain-containing protein [Azonexus sp.]
MTITSLGVGSGMDLNGLLTSLMQAEQRPLVALQTKEASYQSRISSLGVLKGSLSSLQTAAKNFIPSTGQTAADKFATLKSSVGDSSILTASTTSSAVAASYTLSNVKLA